MNGPCSGTSLNEDLSVPPIAGGVDEIVGSDIENIDLVSAEKLSSWVGRANGSSEEEAKGDAKLFTMTKVCNKVTD